MAATRFNLFIYGTGRDPDLRRIIFGRKFPERMVTAGKLSGFRAAPMVNRVEPGLVEAPGAEIAGDVLSDLMASDMARFVYYEALGDYDASRETIDVGGESVTAWVLRCDPEDISQDSTWEFEGWKSRFKARALAMARTRMAQLKPDDVEELSHELRTRLAGG